MDNTQLHELIKVTIESLEEHQNAKVKAAATKIKIVVEDFGTAGRLALAFVGSEYAAREEERNGS